MNPKQLFLIDGLGALLSAFLLGVVLVRYEEFFGIPHQTLYFLALFPCLFALYDLYCYRGKRKDLGPFLRGIGIANILYCGLSLGLAFYHGEALTYFGWTYIIIEIMVVITLAVLELKVARKAIRSI
ncbi:hypothetical protein ACFQ1M_14150 [Sungkyunkwania multivorans]|uniref:Integral membrane protein n=1 Tax=Sungkyunkwania multivorans TaxID=1173618 RepID=A0ABW3D1K5_9FLAO